MSTVVGQGIEHRNRGPLLLPQPPRRHPAPDFASAYPGAFRDDRSGRNDRVVADLARAQRICSEEGAIDQDGVNIEEENAGKRE